MSSFPFSPAVTAGTLTTAIVFLPTIVSPNDQIALFLKHVAISICVALIASLLLSQTIIPLLTSRLKPPTPKKNVVDRWIDSYGRMLAWTIRHRAAGVVMVLVVLGSVAIPARFVKVDMFPDDDQRRVRLFYNIQGNYTVEKVEAAVSEVEAFLFEHQDELEIKSVYSYYTGNYAFSSVFLKEDGADRSVDDIKEDIRDGIPKLAIASPSFDRMGGMGGAEAVSISLEGESSEVLYRLSIDVEHVLGWLEGFDDVKSEADLGGEEVHVVVDRLRALQDADSQSMENLKNLPLVNGAGQQIKLASVADFAIAQGPQQVRRTNRKTVLDVEATLSGITVGDAKDRISGVMVSAR